MDIPREKKRSPKKYILSGLAIAAVTVTTVGLSRLKPAAPRVDRAAIWFGHVEQGELVRQVRGPGTLVPEGMRFVSALNSGRVEEKLRLPGDTVTADTVILRMTILDAGRLSRCRMPAIPHMQAQTLFLAMIVIPAFWMHSRSTSRSASSHHCRTSSGDWR